MVLSLTFIEVGLLFVATATPWSIVFVVLFCNSDQYFLWVHFVLALFILLLNAISIESQSCISLFSFDTFLFILKFFLFLLMAPLLVADEGNVDAEDDNEANALAESQRLMRHKDVV